MDHDALARVGRGRVRGRGADDGALVHDAPPADGHAAVRRVQPRPRVHHRLGADVDGVVAGQQRRVGDNDGRGEVHGCLGTRGRAGEDRLPFAGGHREKVVVRNGRGFSFRLFFSFPFILGCTRWNRNLWAYVGL